MSKNQIKNRSVEGSGNDKLFNDIDILSKALYEDKPHPRIVNSTASSRSKSIVKPRLPEPKSKSKINNEDRFLKDKKSIWSWNTFKSSTHIRNKRFNCCFSLQVHSIENLPPSFNNLTLCVKWKRRDGELTTRPAQVHQGVAEFEELLTNTCSVYGSRSGPHHSAKYESKHFLLYASVFHDPELDLGKHRIDLTRLLPLTLEELEDEKSSGKWTTSYKLSGKVKGAILNVSFGYSVVGNSPSPINKSPGQTHIKRGESLPVVSQSHSSTCSIEDIKDLHEVLPVSKSELSESVSVLYKKLEEEKSMISVDYETQRDIQIVPLQHPNQDSDFLEHPKQDLDFLDPDKTNMTNEFSVVEQGIEFPVKEKIQDGDPDIESLLLNNTKEQEFGEKELILQELELALNNVNQESDSQESENLEEHKEGKKVIESEKMEVVADDFLNMLGIEHSPFSLSSESESSSPRERLLRQFEKDALKNGSSLFNFNLDDDFDDETGFICDSSSSSIPIPIPEEHNTLPEPQNRTKASILEDMETEALMHEFGLNEKLFQGSPSGGQVDFSPPEDQLELPPLGEGLGPFVQTNDGGFLRSMSPEIFKNAKSGGNLIMQVSSPVVVPSEMGSGIMDVLQGLASVGIEKLSIQANKLMPLEDISGKTLQEIAPDHPKIQSSGEISRKYDLGVADPEYVSLEDLAPLAMNKIEALSIEGLRIQSGMSEKEAPLLNPQSISVNLDGSLGLEGTGGLQLLDIKNRDHGGHHDDGHDDMDDGIMGLSVSLDEWMRLDCGEIDDSERTSKILAAHHASDVMRVKRGKGLKKGGLLGNNFTVALMVQLRDPLRDFEPVGTPMLALVQVERVFVPPKPKIYSSIYSIFKEIKEVKEVKEDEEKDEVKVKEVEVEENVVMVPEFKIVEVHVAGVKSEVEEESKKKVIWGGDKKQQQAGSRWLVANGMGKKNGKHPLMKAKVGGGGGGSLWSISSKGKGKGKVDLPVRNPNVIIPNDTVKLLSRAGFV